jgi:hypothetical protein
VAFDPLSGAQIPGARGPAARGQHSTGSDPSLRPALSARVVSLADFAKPGHAAKGTVANGG